MNNNEYQNINLNLYGTDIINVKVPRDKEKLWRSAAQLINEKLNAYFDAYKGKKSDTEIRYYAMIDIALGYITESQRNDVAPITNILSKLSDEINAELK